MTTSYQDGSGDDTPRCDVREHKWYHVRKPILWLALLFILLLALFVTAPAVVVGKKRREMMEHRQKESSGQGRSITGEKDKNAKTGQDAVLDRGKSKE